ncbi:hypothetical protein QQ045_024037 [Rhodiola kirilowii]
MAIDGPFSVISPATTAVGREEAPTPVLSDFLNIIFSGRSGMDSRGKIQMADSTSFHSSSWRTASSSFHSRASSAPNSIKEINFTGDVPKPIKYGSRSDKSEILSMSQKEISEDDARLIYPDDPAKTNARKKNQNHHLTPQYKIKTSSPRNSLFRRRESQQKCLHPPEVEVAVDSASMEAIESENANLNISGKPPMGLTENFSPTFLATGNPCLDFFFHVVPDTPPADLISRLELAWSFDPLTALKLICNLRGVRGTWKSEKEGFYGSALWLFKKHPKTLTLDLKSIADFGYFKDLPEILYRISEGVDCQKMAKEMYESRKRKGCRGSSRGWCSERGSVDDSEDEHPAAVVVNKETAIVLRKEREAAKLKKAIEKYNFDLNYRNLHDGVAHLFAELLKLDLSYLSSGELYKISLAAKWCPSIDRSYDKATLICGNVAKRLFPRESDEVFGKIEEEEYVSRARNMLRKNVLVPLRKALELPEVYMSAKEWNNLKYERVASVATKNYKKLFVKHDSERFAEYLADVKSGKAKIAAGALLPHQIIKCLEDEDGGEVAELQWNRMVEDMKKKGKLDRCIAVCDVSGSMAGIPMEVSVALGLLLSELSEEPWKGNVFTFSANPQLHIIQGDNLKDKTDFIRSMDWGGCGEWEAE